VALTGPTRHAHARLEREVQRALGVIGRELQQLEAWREPRRARAEAPQAHAQPDPLERVVTARIGHDLLARVVRIPHARAGDRASALALDDRALDAAGGAQRELAERGRVPVGRGARARAALLEARVHGGVSGG